LDDVVKIGGELVSVARLDEVLESVRGTTDAALVVASDERLGVAIHLATSAGDAEQVRGAFDALVLPFERIRRAHRLPIPRTALGKVRRAELRRAVERLLEEERGQRLPGGEE
jgi:acyl-coenzyme A synthetase/AMP-(fatty) acid ligase